MALSTKERYMGIAVGAAAALFALDYFALSPYMDRSSQIDKSIADARKTLENNRLILAKQSHLKPVWDQMQKNGLKLDTSLAESQMEINMKNWIEGAGLVPENFHQDQTRQASDNKQFTIISYNYILSGTMRSLATLLMNIETAPIPVRINELNVNTPKEGVDLMLIHLSITALCMPPQETTTPKQMAPPAQAS